MVGFTEFAVFNLNSILHHQNFTKKLVSSSVFLRMLLDGAGLDTLGTSREWIKMCGQERWMILWCLWVFPEDFLIYIGVMSSLTISITLIQGKSLYWRLGTMVKGDQAKGDIITKNVTHQRWMIIIKDG